MKHVPGRNQTEVDRITGNRFVIIATVIGAIVFALFVFPFPTNFHQYFINAAMIWKIAGIVTFVVWIWFVWKKLRQSDTDEGESYPAWILLGLLLLMIFFLGGWTFIAK